jgi:hypothetical protein
VTCPEKFPAAEAGASLDGAADPGACVSLRPAMQIERWMRKSLRSVSAQKAVDLLRRIKAVTVTSPGGSSRVTTVVTAEQKDLLKRLGVPPLSGVLPESCSV